MSTAIQHFYVHWLAGDNEKDSELKQAYANYFQHKLGTENEIAFKTYSNAIRKQFQGNEKEAERYLNAISDIVNDSAFQAVFNEAFNRFSVLNTEAQSTTNIKELANKLEEKADVLDDIIGQYKNIIKFLGENIDVDNIQSYTSLNPILSDKAKKLFGIKNSGKNSLITKAEYLKMGGYYRAIYASLVKKVNDFSTKVSSLSSDGLTKVTPEELSTMLFGIANSVRPIAGIMAEYVVENVAQEMKSALNGLKINKASERVSKDEKKSGQIVQTFTKKTKDLEININGISGYANFNFDQGGITSKRTTTGKSESLIHLKGKGTKLLNYIRETDLNLEAFYNVYANNKWFDNNITTNMYNTVHGIIIAKALAGSLTQNDISVIMVINNKPFTIFDLLNNDGDYSKYIEYIIEPKLPTLASAISAAHQKIQINGETPIKQARKRSNKIISEINKQHIGVTLKLKGLI